MSNKVCVPNKTEDLNINVFNMVTRRNKNGKYLASIIDNSVVTCDEIIRCGRKKPIPTNYQLNYHCIIDSCSHYCYLIEYK